MSEVFHTQRFPEDGTVMIIDRLKAALVSEITESVMTGFEPVFGFGDSRPCAYSEGKSVYKLTLTRIPGSDMVTVPTDRSFTLMLTSNAGTTLYSSCRCTQTERIHKAGEPMTERLTVIALKREEEY